MTGGDKPLVAAARRLLSALADLPVRVHIGVGTPNRSTLLEVPDQVLVVRIAVCEAVPLPTSPRPSPPAGVPVQPVTQSARDRPPAQGRTTPSSQEPS